MKILVTGAAGFIGFHTARALLARGEEVLGLDNLSPYYDVRLKEARLSELRVLPGFRFIEADLADRDRTAQLFATERPQRVVHLAAQPGVRHAIKDPYVYGSSNLTGFLHVLEGCRHARTEHLVYASSSSVYGANTQLPFSVHQNVDHPLSLYAATKKANELMAHSYAHMYGLPQTGLRFFTVYGPWGRPDMAPFIFTRKILAGEPIDVFNRGEHLRDFTYIDDVVEGVVRTLDRVAAPDPQWDAAHPDPATSSAPHRLYNIGNNSAVPLLYLIECIEKALGKKAKMNFLPRQPGDMPATWADVSALTRDVGFRPDTPIERGIQLFVDWYRAFYKT